MKFSKLPGRLKNVLSRPLSSARDEKRQVPSQPGASLSAEPSSLPVQARAAGWAGKGKGEHSARRINRIAAEMRAQTYLEIGVSRGLTFRDVKIARKVGVDPRFRCDVAALRETGSEMHEITSDQYFADHA